MFGDAADQPADVTPKDPVDGHAMAEKEVDRCHALLVRIGTVRGIPSTVSQRDFGGLVINFPALPNVAGAQQRHDLLGTS